MLEIVVRPTVKIMYFTRTALSLTVLGFASLYVPGAMSETPTPAGYSDLPPTQQPSIKSNERQEALMISVEDQRALEDLHNRYVHAIDRRDFALLRSLYTDDAIEHHGDYVGPVDGFIEWLPQANTYFEGATHVVTNLLFTVDGDTAQSEGRGTAYLRLKADPPFNMIVINRLFDQYRKVDGRWLFSRRAVSVDWVQQFPSGEADLDLTASIPAGTNDLNDPVYHNVPGLISALRNGLPPIK